jgi:hypothetical protein
MTVKPVYSSSSGGENANIPTLVSYPPDHGSHEATIDPRQVEDKEKDLVYTDGTCPAAAATELAIHPGGLGDTVSGPGTRGWLDVLGVS